MKKFSLIKPCDIIVILVIVLLGVGLSVFGKGDGVGLSARVTVEGEEVYVFDLSKETERSVTVGGFFIAVIG